MFTEKCPLFDLGSRVALVTGGGGGFGREFCDVLAEFGADVVCCDLYQDRAIETCEIINKYGHRTLAIEVDVTKYELVRAMFKQVENAFGRLDVLVNNAGVTTRSVLMDGIDIAEWHRVLDVNLHGVFYCMKEGLRIMMKQTKGSIINIASICGLYGVEPDILATAPYVASKSAVVGLTKQGAAEYGRHGIRVNCIAPGWHSGTKLAESAGIRRTEEERKARQQMLATKTPLHRVGEPNDVRGLLLFLASDASDFITGQTIAEDGGWTCV